MPIGALEEDFPFARISPAEGEKPQGSAIDGNC